MKKFVYASVLAIASLSLVCTQSLRAQDQIAITDQAEFNAYQNATTQTDPNAKAAALESFLSTYPQSKVKKAVIDMLIDTYQAAGNADKTVDAAGRLLQIDPNNLKAIFISVYIDKAQKKWDDAAALAQKGLTVKKPAGVNDADWKAQTAGSYPIFHSALAAQALAKGDYKTAISEFNTELQLTPADGTGNVLNDMLALAEAYKDPKAKDARDLVKACWFYARVWDFAPANYKPTIEKSLEYWYQKYSGKLDGLDALKKKAALTMFPGGDTGMTKAATPAEIADNVVKTTSDLGSLALADKEYILANGSKDSVDKVWAVMKDQPTPVPGIVIESSASVIKVAVTQDSKDAKTADFIVNMKTPLADKDIPAVGYEFKIATPKEPAATLQGTQASFTLVPATDTNPYASALIVINDAIIVPPAKKTPPPHAGGAHKPTPGHHQ